MSQHQQYNYTSNFQGQELGDAQLRLNVDGESFDYQPSGPDVEIDIDADLVIDGTTTFEEFRTEYFAKDRPVWLKTGGMYQILVPFLGVNPDGYYEFARVSDDGSDVMWWHLSQDGWTHGTTRLEQSILFNAEDLVDESPIAGKAFAIARCKTPENIGDFAECEVFLQLNKYNALEVRNWELYKLRVSVDKSGADSYNLSVIPLYQVSLFGQSMQYLIEKVCIHKGDGYMSLVLVQGTDPLNHLGVNAAISTNVGTTKTPWYTTKSVMEKADVLTGGIQYYIDITECELQSSKYRLKDQVDTLNQYNYVSPKALGSFIPTRTYGVARTYTEGVGDKYAVIATFKDDGGSSDIFASHFCVQVATNSGNTDGKRTCGTFHIFISGVGGYGRNIRCWWESVTTDSELAGTAPKSMHLVKDGDNYSLVLEFTDRLNGGATSDVAFITVLQNATRFGDTVGHMTITNGGWAIPITSWMKSGGSTQRVNTTASLPAGTDTEYLFADGTLLHSINQNGIAAGEDVLAPFMYKVSTPTFNYPGRQGFFGLALADGKSYLAKITLTGQTATRAVVVAIDTTADDVRLRYASGDVGIIDYTDNDDPDDTNYLKFFKSDDGDSHYYLTIKCGYVNAYETCTATVELVCFDYSQNSSPISSGTSLSIGTWPTYAQNRTQKFAAIAIDGPLDQSVANASTSTTTAPCTKAVYEFAAQPNGIYPNMSVGFANAVAVRMEASSYLDISWSTASWSDFCGTGADSLIRKVFGSNFTDTGKTTTVVGRCTGLPTDFADNTGYPAYALVFGQFIGVKCRDAFFVKFFANAKTNGQFPVYEITFGLSATSGLRSITKNLNISKALNVFSDGAGSPSQPVYVDSNGEVKPCNAYGTQTFTDSEAGYRTIAMIPGPTANGTDVFTDFEIECYSVPFVPTVIRITTDTRKDGGGTYYFKYSKAIIIAGTADGSIEVWSNPDGRLVIVVKSTAHYSRYVCKLLRAMNYANDDLSSAITLNTTQQQLNPSVPGGWSVVTPT